jgi:hypothetical protein
VALLVGLTILLWFLSVGYTAGGLFYSLRVLSPAFALLAVTASYGLALTVQSRMANRILAAGIALGLLESLPKTLVLPENPYRAAPRDWLQAANSVPLLANQWDARLLEKVQPLPGRHRIVSDYVGAPKLFARINTEVAPLWSPEIAWLFDATLPPEEVARRWQKSGLRYLVLLKSGPTVGFIPAHARWRAPYFTLNTVAETDAFRVLEASVPVTPGAK